MKCEKEKNKKTVSSEIFVTAPGSWRRGIGEVLASIKNSLHAAWIQHNVAHAGRSTDHIPAVFSYSVHVKIPKPGQSDKD